MSFFLRLNNISLSSFPGSSDGKEFACSAGDLGLIPGSGTSPEEGNRPAPVFLPGEFHGQGSLSITNSRSLLKLMLFELVMPSNHLILCCPLLLLPSIFPTIRVFSNKLDLRIRWPSFGVSASASVLPMNVQDWFPLGWTGLISLQ